MAFALPVAEEAAGAVASRRAAAGAAKKATARKAAAPGTGSAAARQRAQIEQIKAQRPEPVDQAPDVAADQLDDGDDTTTPTPSSGTRSGGPAVSVNVHQAAHTGGGFLLGAAAWMVGVTFLRGGTPAVRKLLAAKFLNKVSA